MAIPPLTSDQIRTAMQKFDAEHRGIDEWVDWEENKNHIYAISDGGKLYPVKQIVSLASGVPRADFTGGVASWDANKPVAGLGFKIVSLRPAKTRNPPWSRDELILALDFYLNCKGNPPSKQSKEIAELSADLNRLAMTLGTTRDEKFRNVNGAYMKLMNFRRFDPAYLDAGKSGLERGGHKEEAVWHDFANDPVRCAETAATIRAFISPNPSSEVSLDDDQFEAEEGRLIAAVHLRRERDRGLVERKKASVLKATGHLACEACGFDFETQYGQRGRGLIECHHERPLHTLMPGQKTKLSDLRLLCANCHRAIHRRPWVMLEDFKKTVPCMSSLGR
jgi:5-methylcytosine-specific restriction protein A